MDNTCPHCHCQMSNWDWIRFAGVGAWNGKNKYYGCPECKLRFDGTAVPKVELIQSSGFNVIEKMSISGSHIRTSHYKDIQSRVLADDGQTVLKGKEGLNYMKSKAKDNPGYAKRLKDYYQA